MKELSQLQQLNDFVDDAAFIRDVSKVKQVQATKYIYSSPILRYRTLREYFRFMLLYSSIPLHSRIK